MSIFGNSIFGNKATHAVADPASIVTPTRDWQIITRDGRRRTLRTTGTTFFRADATSAAPGEWLMVTATLDVTAERQTERSLLEAGHRLNTVLSSITEGYLVLDDQRARNDLCWSVFDC